MEPRRGSRNALLVIATLLAVSSSIGVFAFWRFSTSDRYLGDVLHQMEAQGASASVEECVDRVVEQAAACQAMKSLCDASAPRWMDACLKARDRADYCAELGDAPKSTHFGFKECKDRMVDRRTKKACGSAYRSIASHCESLGRKEWVSSVSR